MKGGAGGAARAGPPVGLALLLALVLPGASAVLTALGLPLLPDELWPATYLLVALALALCGPRSGRLSITPAAIFLLLYACWEAAALARAAEGAAGLAKLAGILPSAALAFILSDAETRANLRRLLPTWLGLFSAALAAYGLVHHFFGNGAAARAMIEQDNLQPEMRRLMLFALEQHRLSILFGNPNQLAALSCLALPFIALLARKENGWRRAGWIAALLLVLAAVLCTKSRGGLLAAGATFVLLAWRGELGLRPSRRAKLAFVAAIALALVLLVVFGGRRLRDAETIRARGEFWSLAAQMIRQRPLVGNGTDGYAFYYAAYRAPGSVEARQPHNLLLEAAVEGGILPVFWAAALLVYLAALPFRRGGDSLAGACRVAAAVFGLQCLWDFHNSLPWLWLLFAAVFALGESPRPLPSAVAWLLAALPLPAVIGFWLGASQWVGAGRTWFYGLALAALLWGLLVPRRWGCVLAALGLLVFAWDVTYVGSLSDSDEEAGMIAWRQGDPTTAGILLSRAAERQPYRPSPWAARGVLAHRMKDDRFAEEALLRAIALSPRTAHQHASLAELYLAEKRAGDALRQAWIAADLHPARAEYRALLSQAFAALGKSDDAARQAEWSRRLSVLPQGGWLVPDLPRSAALRATLPPPEPAP